MAHPECVSSPILEGQASPIGRTHIRGPSVALGPRTAGRRSRPSLGAVTPPDAPTAAADPSPGPSPPGLGYNGRMLRLNWPAIIVAVLFIALVARRPGLLFNRAFFPVLLVAGIVVLIGYRRRRPAGRGRRP